MWWDDRQPRLSHVEPGARVSPMAAIGYAGEWRGKASTFPARIEADATVSEFARVQAGVVRETVVHRNAFIMAGAHIGHDAIVGENADVCPNAVVCGGAEIGPNAKVYSGAVVSPNVKIGDWAIIAANSTVNHDVPPAEVWGGSPARFIRMRNGFGGDE